MAKWRKCYSAVVITNYSVNAQYVHWTEHHYLEPWCKNPKQSRDLAENLKYIPVAAPLRNKSTIFSTNLVVANRTPAPCSRKSGEKRIGSGISLAPTGVPWNTDVLIRHTNWCPWTQNDSLYTSKRIQRRIWNPIIGIFIMWPPISDRPHSLSWFWSSSGATTKPLFQSRYLVVIEDELDCIVRGFWWITGLDHFVQTRKAKHSAMLRTTCSYSLVIW